MLNEIFSDLWKNYRGRLLGSVYRRNVFDLRLSADDFSAHMYYCRVLPRQ